MPLPLHKEKILWRNKTKWISVVAASTLNGLEDAYFSKSPKNMDVDSGKSVTLPCEVTPDSGITYYWELNGNKKNFKQQESDFFFDVVRFENRKYDETLPKGFEPPHHEGGQGKGFWTVHLHRTGSNRIVHYQFGCFFKYTL